MADNITLNPGSGGSIVASDDVSGVQHQLVKLEYGADGSATQVSGTAPLPVQEFVATDVYSTTVAAPGVAGSQEVDINANLGRNATVLLFQCPLGGTNERVTVELKQSASGSYLQPLVLIHEVSGSSGHEGPCHDEQIYRLEGISVDTLRLTWENPANADMTILAW